MIAGLKPYPAMRDSGVSWLGELPEHWHIRRIKTLFREKDERKNSKEATLLSLTRARGLLPQSEASSRIASAEDLTKYKVCRPGDLVMNRMQAWSGMFAFCSQMGVVSPDYSVFGSIGHHEVRFFEYLFKTPVLVDQFAQSSKGIGSGFNRLYTDDFGALQTVVPPVPEQAVIVRFLDHADRRIRRYIRAKQKLIKLLEEQKQAIIHRAVTRGLDPNVRLKPSGAEWLGDVPEDWESRSLASVAESIQTGPFGSQVHASDYVTAGVPLINPAHMKDGQIVVDRRVTVTPDKAVELGRHQLRSGDLVAARRGELGRCALVTDNEAGWLCGTGSIRIRPRKEIVEPAYLMFAFSSQAVRDFLALASIGATMDNLSGSVVARAPLRVPPFEEQAAIVKFVESKSRQIDVTVAHVKREVDLIREYRTCLIADVVTGKVDVREAAARLPDEADELEVLDEPDALTDAEDAAADDLDPELEGAEA